MHCGIDGDVLIYQSAFAVEARGYICYDEDGSPIAFHKYKKDTLEYPEVKPYRCVAEEDTDSVMRIFNAKIESIVRRTGATSSTIYLTGNGNFRNDIYDNYKSSRGDKPLLYQFIRDYAEAYVNCVVVDGQEADDALSIAQYNNPNGHITATIDKDLLMVPGHHYNPNKDEARYVTKEEGLKTFYTQILTGDSIDDIPGIKGIGPKKAQKILEGIEDEDTMWLTVVNKWAEYLQHDSVLDTVIRNARLLWMRSVEDEMWEPPCEL